MQLRMVGLLTRRRRNMTIDRSPEGYARIMNAGSGHLISVTDMLPYAECLPYNASYWSDESTINTTSDGYSQFVNRWSGDALYVTDLTGYVERGPGNPAYWSGAGRSCPRTSAPQAHGEIIGSKLPMTLASRAAAHLPCFDGASPHTPRPLRGRPSAAREANTYPYPTRAALVPQSSACAERWFGNP